MRDPYEVLGIQRGATDDEIKKAYRAKCKRWHPDLNPNDPTAEEHFKEVQAAYDAITKGETQQQAGGYGYGQQGYSNPYGNYQQQGSYQQNGYYSSQNNGYTDFGGFDFDPFGFGFNFGGYQQQSGASYNSSDSAEMQAARNFIMNRRYAEARRVLDSMNARNARWYSAGICRFKNALISGNSSSINTVAITAIRSFIKNPGIPAAIPDTPSMTPSEIPDISFPAFFSVCADSSPTPCKPDVFPVSSVG